MYVMERWVFFFYFHGTLNGWLGTLHDLFSTLVGFPGTFCIVYMKWKAGLTCLICKWLSLLNVAYVKWYVIACYNIEV
jgi:hypothetical protein